MNTRLSECRTYSTVEDICDSISAFPDAVKLTSEQKAELDRRIEDYRLNPGREHSWETIKAPQIKRILELRPAARAEFDDAPQIFLSFMVQTPGVL